MRKPKGLGKPLRKTLEARQKQDSDMEHNKNYFGWSEASALAITLSL